MGLDPSEEELQDMIQEIDDDQNGTVSFIEFVGKSIQHWSITSFHTIINKWIGMIKKAADTNKSSREELFRAFQMFGRLI